MKDRIILNTLTMHRDERTGIVISFNIENEKVLLTYKPSGFRDDIMLRLGLESDISENGRSKPEIASDESGFSVSEKKYLWLKKVFYLYRDDLILDRSDEWELVFDFGHLGADDFEKYYVIPKERFGIPQDVFVSNTIKLDYRLFCVGYNRQTSAIAKISSLLAPDVSKIIIGGDHPDAVPQETYEELLNIFPTTSTLTHYGEALIQHYLQDYLEPKKDYISGYEASISRKQRITSKGSIIGDEISNNLRSEAMHYASEKLHNMLKEGETIPESEWQEGILGILPILFPQYVSVIPKARVKDVINNTFREIDYLLIDASGNVDVLEIKKAFPKRSLLMARTYRDNFVPARELVGGIAQIEKYIHYLTNWARQGEVTLTQKYTRYLPEDLKLNFVHPRGILLIGHCDFTQEEKQDFDILRRQYSHIADIITYDDLLNRFDRILKSLNS